MQRLLTMAAERGLIAREDVEMIGAVFFGVLLGNTQMRLLLGVGDPADAGSIEDRVRLAIAATKRLVPGG